MLSTKLSTSAAIRAVQPSMVLKCVAARYSGNVAARYVQGAAIQQLPAKNQFRAFGSTRIVEWGAREFFHSNSNWRSGGSDDFLHLDHDHLKEEEHTLHYEM